MLITVTTSSQDLLTILSSGQETVANSTKYSDSSVGYHKVLIQVLGATDVYLDFGQASTTTAGIKLVQGETFSFNDVNLADCNLIADGGNNADVRIIAN